MPRLNSLPLEISIVRASTLWNVIELSGFPFFVNIAAYIYIWQSYKKTLESSFELPNEIFIISNINLEDHQSPMDNKDVETFMSLTGATRSQAVQKLEVYKGDLNAAIDSYLSETERSTSLHNGAQHEIRGETEPRRLSNRRRSPMLTDTFWNPFSAFDDISRRFFDRSSMFHNTGNSEQTRNVRTISIDWNDEYPRGNIGIERVAEKCACFLQPHISHPKEVRNIEIDWKDTEGEASRTVSEPHIEEIPEEEHGGYDPGLEGNVTVVDEDSPRHLPREEREFTRKQQTECLSSAPKVTELPLDVPTDFEDLDDELLQEAIEISKREAEASNRNQDHGLNDVFTSEGDIYNKSSKLEKEDLNLEMKGSLPLEPSLDEENTISVLVRMPDGHSYCRVFKRSDKIELLFVFVEKVSGVRRGTYKLVRHYPRKTITSEERMEDLSGMGLTNKQEALFLEFI